MYRICTQRRQTINLTFYNQIIRIIDEKTTDKAKILHTLLAEMSTIISLIFSATIKRKFKLSRSHGGWEDDKKKTYFPLHFFYLLFCDQTIWNISVWFEKILIRTFLSTMFNRSKKFPEFLIIIRKVFIFKTVHPSQYWHLKLCPWV